MKRDCDICDVCLERQGKDNPNETFERIAGKITRTLRSVRSVSSSWTCSFRVCR